jgi:hypothetical protein
MYVCKNRPEGLLLELAVKNATTRVRALSYIVRGEKQQLFFKSAGIST